MKNFFRLIPLFIVLLSCCSCLTDDDSDSNLTDTNTDTQCTENTVSNIKTVNLFDVSTNQAVANFKFVQESNTYSGGTNCPQMNCMTTLTIQNLTPHKLTFDYNILFHLNLVNWNYQGFLTVLPGSSVDAGEISNSCASISLGSIMVQSAHITYD